MYLHVSICLYVFMIVYSRLYVCICRGVADHHHLTEVRARLAEWLNACVLSKACKPNCKHKYQAVSGVVWCGVVWCGVVWCGVVWCGVVWCGVVWCGVVWCYVV